MQSFLAWRQGLQINFPSESPAPCRLSGPGKRGVLGLRSDKIAVISSSYNFVAECGSRAATGIRFTLGPHCWASSEGGRDSPPVGGRRDRGRNQVLTSWVHLRACSKGRWERREEHDASGCEPQPVSEGPTCPRHHLPHLLSMVGSGQSAGPSFDPRGQDP